MKLFSVRVSKRNRLYFFAIDMCEEETPFNVVGRIYEIHIGKLCAYVSVPIKRKEWKPSYIKTFHPKGSYSEDTI